MSSDKPYRQSDIYVTKLMRLGAAMRRYSEHHLPKDQNSSNFNSLALEVDALEELSLSSFSLMKAIKKNLKDEAADKAKLIEFDGEIRERGLATNNSWRNSQNAKYDSWLNKMRAGGATAAAQKSCIINPFPMHDYDDDDR